MQVQQIICNFALESIKSSHLGSLLFAKGEEYYILVRDRYQSLIFWVKSENNFDVKTMYNTQGDVDYNKELAVFEVKGYDYNANNVGIRVKGQDGLLFDIKFPKAGEAPMIIAVDPSQQWMKERVSVPSEWFY